jgi:hypothetical protein
VSPLFPVASSKEFEEVQDWGEIKKKKQPELLKIR